MGLELTIFSLPITRLNSIRMNNKDYFVEFLKIEYKLRKSFSECKKCHQYIGPAIELFHHTFEGKSIDIDKVFYFSGEIVDCFNLENEGIDINKIKLFHEYTDDTLYSAHKAVLYDIEQIGRVQVRRLPIEFNGLKLIVTEKNSPEYDFIDLKQLKNLDLEYIKSILEKKYREKYGDENNKGRIEPIFKFLAETRGLGEDLFYFETL